MTHLRAFKLIASISLLLFSACVHSGETAYVTNQNGNSITIVDLENASVITTLDVPGEPAGVSSTPDGAWVVVTSPGIGKVNIIETRVPALVASIATGPGPLAVICTNHSFWVADWHENRIDEFSLPDGKLLRSSTVGTSPSGLAINPDHDTLFVSNRDDNTVSAISLDSLAVKKIMKTGARPFGLHFDADNQRLFSANVASNSVTVIDTNTLTSIQEIPVGERPYDITTTHKGRYVYVSNQYDDTVSVIDTHRWAVIETLSTGEYPEGIATLADDRTVVVSNWFDNSIMLVDSESGNSITAEVPVGDGPRSYGDFIVSDKKLPD